MSAPGRVIDELFTAAIPLVLANGDPATGMTLAVVWGIDGDDAAWAPTAPEVGATGVYLLTDTPEVTGWHHAWLSAIDLDGNRRNVATSERIVSYASSVPIRPGQSIEWLVLATDANGFGVATPPTVVFALDPEGTTFVPTITAVVGVTGAYLVSFTVPNDDDSIGSWLLAVDVATAQPYQAIEGWDVAAPLAATTNATLGATISIERVGGGAVWKITRGDTTQWTWTIVESDGETAYNLTGCTLWFTAKRTIQDADANAIVRHEWEDGGETDSIVVTDPLAGIATHTITAEESAEIRNNSLRCDIQLMDSSGVVKTLLERRWLIIDGDVTQRVTVP